MCADSQTTSTEAALRTVADRRRRTVLQHLIDSEDEVVTTDELVAAITDGEAFSPRRRRDRVDRIRIELHHVHLPKLADAGIVDYDARSGAVRYRPDDGIETAVRFVSGQLRAR